MTPSEQRNAAIRRLASGVRACTVREIRMLCEMAEGMREEAAAPLVPACPRPGHVLTAGEVIREVTGGRRMVVPPPIPRVRQPS